MRLNQVGDLIDGTNAIDTAEDATLGVAGHHGFGLLVVQIQAVADDGFVVIAAAGLDGAAQQACHQFLVVGGQLHDDVELRIGRGQDRTIGRHRRPTTLADEDV